MYRTYRVELNGCPVAWRVYTDFAEALRVYQKCRSGETVRVYGVDLLDRHVLLANLQQVCRV